MHRLDFLKLSEQFFGGTGVVAAFLQSGDDFVLASNVLGAFGDVPLGLFQTFFAHDAVHPRTTRDSLGCSGPTRFGEPLLVRRSAAWEQLHCMRVNLVGASCSCPSPTARPVEPSEIPSHRSTKGARSAWIPELSQGSAPIGG